MHELSLCHAIAGVVRPHAADREVSVIHVRIGALRQVIPETLTFCWDLVAAQEGFDGARLEIDPVPASVSCASCSVTSDIESRYSTSCPVCGSSEVSVVGGEEFLITSIDVRSASPSAASSSAATTPERA
ncbi:hydrogenase maturation nickel metallochaperone HypA [Gordonia rhizosphera]|uniref:Hydrogenase maturation factor HypA n=1 Tax=Gordonia rhizosphera NBRC 16068 TaxID=1108045 RepID=K6V5J3_9ACTN|nr:hydrogenase maturation nickel metallochaperone HypA [Gordonia rhizosphera]GAB91518.1 NiFe-hydrogenase nickel incorporation protein HypA [Gordonia rhizosphera NBRC 16068]